MARGGKRPGAGRKAGVLNKRTQEIAAKAAASGITPLEYMLSILRDESQKQDARFLAAKEAAPYIHAKLASIEHKGDAESPLETIMRIELTAPQIHGHSSN